MKNVRRVFCLVAMLLVAVALPLTEHGVNAVVQRKAVMTPPHVVADSLPVPWCKEGPPRCIGVASPQAVADSLPVPWGKKPGGARVDVLPAVADSLPVPWGKKPGGTQS